MINVNIVKSLKRLIIQACLVITVLPCLISCDDSIPYSDRTVLVYLMAENSLSNNAYSNLEDMVKGVEKGIGSGSLVCYFDPIDAPPSLIHITPKGKKTIREYSEQNSSSPEVMRSVIEEVRSKFPSSSYGLVLWSHGTGWMPATISSSRRMSTFSTAPYSPLVKRPAATTRAFGQDGNNWMDLNDLQNGIPDKAFDFIMFDACYMSQIEVAYALKDKTPYIIASPTEVLATGFPYAEIIDNMFVSQLDLKGVCKEYFDHYNAQTGFNKSATIALIKTEKLQQISELAKAIYMPRLAEIESFNVSALQYYDRNYTHTMFDLDQFVRLLAPEEATQFTKLLNEIIVYKAATPIFLGGNSGSGITINLENFSGISTYVPISSYSLLNQSYYLQDWYRAVYE